MPLLRLLASEACRAPLELWFLVLVFLVGKTSISPSESESDSSVRPLNGSFQVLRLLKGFVSFLIASIDYGFRKSSRVSPKYC